MPAAGHGFTREGTPVLVGGLGWCPATFGAATLTEFEVAWRARSGDAGRGANTITAAEARRIALARGGTLYGE